MTFIEPFLLWGTGAVAIPIAIHFWHQKRGKPLPWAATQWLTEQNQQQSRGLRLDNVFLLLLRCLLLGLLAFLLAQPVLNGFKQETVVRRVHLVQPTGLVTSNFRFELDEAHTKGEPVVLLNKAANPLALQTVIDSLPAENTELHLYAVNNQALASVPAITVPARFRLHTVVDSAAKPRPYVALTDIKRLYIDRTGKLTSSATPDPTLSFQTAPVHSGPIQVRLNYQSAPEQRTVLAALLALAGAYGLPLRIDDKRVVGVSYDWVLANRSDAASEPAKNPKTLYTISGNPQASSTGNAVYTPETLTPQTSELVANGQLPEWLGEQLIRHYGLAENELPVSQSVLNGLFVSSTKQTQPQQAGGQDALTMLFIGLLILERWIALTKKRMNKLNQMLLSVTYQLQANALIRSALVAASVFLFAASLGLPVVVSLLIAIAGFMVGAILTGAFQNKKQEAIQRIHQSVGDTEYSLPLLDKPQLNLAEQLQLERLGERVRDTAIPGLLFGQVGLYTLGLLLAMAMYVGYPLLRHRAAATPEQLGAKTTAPPGAKPMRPPAFQSATVQIQPPAYTRLPRTTSGDLNVVALVGSQLMWQIRFSDNRNLAVRIIDSRGRELPLQTSGVGFRRTDQLLNSGLYALKAYWHNPTGRDSVVYQSDFYRLEATPDLAPKIEPVSKELYRFHYVNDPATLTVAARLSDDFSVSNAFIVATVARGSGESVKFREVRMPLGRANFGQANLAKTLDLKALNFAPGDELYYYWAAFDNRRPEPNFTKSDTYFVVYKDTTQTEESELATMAVNIMPEYFRSQRQIIIDTEKLLAKRKKIAAQSFKSQSNEIGFDQKVLRLRYGQFLGEEFETSAGGGHIEPTNENGDPLAGFVHDHDKGEGDEHEAGHKEEVHQDAHDHGHGGNPSTDSKDPIAALMEQYVHAHDNAETNTFHEQSTRALLKMALEQMWQSELHLRLYEPEKALPYEQKALEYLKLSQQKARSYVKKTGFDPPPIKEKELRLTGELKNVAPSFSQERTLNEQRIDPLVADVLGYLDGPALTHRQRLTVQQLGTTLTNRALNSGLDNWSVLASLQKLAGGRALSMAEKTSLKTKLYRLTGIQSERTGRSYTSDRMLERAFWKQLK